MKAQCEENHGSGGQGRQGRKRPALRLSVDRSVTAIRHPICNDETSREVTSGCSPASHLAVSFPFAAGCCGHRMTCPGVSRSWLRRKRWAKRTAADRSGRHGDIWFIYRPKVRAEDQPEQDVGASGMSSASTWCSSPMGAARVRLMTIGAKRLPDTDEHERIGVSSIWWQNRPVKLPMFWARITMPRRPVASVYVRPRGQPEKGCTCDADWKPDSSGIRAGASRKAGTRPEAAQHRRRQPASRSPIKTRRRDLHAIPAWTLGEGRLPGTAPGGIP